MNQGRRLALGIFVLLLVDIIWVASSELSEYIFNDTGFDKPFFSTYLKTSMFSLYLLGFIFWRPWRHQCMHGNQDDRIYQEVDFCEDSIDDMAEDNHHLQPVVKSQHTPLPIFTVAQVASSVALDNDDSAQLIHAVFWRYLPTQPPASPASVIPQQKSEPSYVPLKQESQEKSSDGDTDEDSVKSVRFSSLTEVRQMSETEALDAMMSRLSFSASVRAEQLAMQEANKLSIKEVMKIACIFCLLWFAGNYAYQIALSQTQAGVVNIISSSSGLFTLILAAIFPSSLTDKFTFSKLLSVFLMIAGVVLVCLEDIKQEGSSLPVGVLWALAGAVLYACYMVFLRRKVPSENQMDFTMFFGFVGLFNTIILWPGFFLLDILGWETFQWPNSQQLLYMTVNGLVGTVLSELLWLWGCFLTSSLMATLSLSLTIPLTVLMDIWLKDVPYSLLIYVGSVPMITSFIAITLLTHYDNWDPLMNAIRYLCRKSCGQSYAYSLLDTEVIERESLIVSSANEDEAEDEEEGEEVEEVDTTLINNPVTLSSSPHHRHPSFTSSNSDVSSGNDVTNHV